MDETNETDGTGETDVIDETNETDGTDGTDETGETDETDETGDRPADDVDRAAHAIGAGELVVYPTETVYGLAGAALDPAAIDRVFDAKRRDRDRPISLAVPSVPAAFAVVRATDRERRFMARFLPGPVTVLCRRREVVPDELTAGSDRVGVRIPDHPTALALCERAGTPITATSANVSGRPSVHRVDELDDEIASKAAVVLDDGPTGGVESTVVDVASETIHRRGSLADDIETWLGTH